MSDLNLTPYERSALRADLIQQERAEHHVCAGDPDCRDCFRALVGCSSIGAALRELCKEEGIHE